MLPNLKIYSSPYGGYFFFDKITFQVVKHDKVSGSLMYVDNKVKCANGKGLYDHPHSALASYISCITARCKQTIDEGICFTYGPIDNFIEELYDEEVEFCMADTIIDTIAFFTKSIDLFDSLNKYVGYDYGMKMIGEMMKGLPMDEYYKNAKKIFDDVKPISFPFKIYDSKSIAPFTVISEKEWYGQHYNDE